jgi:hypothetical protein
MNVDIVGHNDSHAEGTLKEGSSEIYDCNGSPSSWQRVGRWVFAMAGGETVSWQCHT